MEYETAYKTRKIGATVSNCDFCDGECVLEPSILLVLVVQKTSPKLRNAGPPQTLV